MLRAIVVASGVVMFGSAAHAHVTLENREAIIGTTYKAVLRVPHGCAGSPTHTVRVQIPAGFTGVKPMPKPGWKLETVKDAAAPAAKNEHGASSAVVKEVIWSGGNLPDEHYDEFVFRGSLSDPLKPNTTVYFPVVQECEKGVERWIEIPAAGKSAGDYKKPAPGLKLLPKP